MRFEGKSEQEAIETALKELKRPASELQYRVIRDEKSFWGGRVVEIEVESGGAAAARESARTPMAVAAPVQPAQEKAVREVLAAPPAPASVPTAPAPAARVPRKRRAGGGSARRVGRPGSDGRRGVSPPSRRP